MSVSKEELRLRVEAKINELKAQLQTLAADGTAEAQKRKDQLAATVNDAQAHLEHGWEQITDRSRFVQEVSDEQRRQVICELSEEALRRRVVADPLRSIHE
ncbi:MAG TPA: hypothetical protein VMS22_13740 [Candidatus Eisenbacteria bacterium]|nr:hypothetical protein [Candidatus Eisenbacteria bacterium]